MKRVNYLTIVGLIVGAILLSSCASDNGASNYVAIKSSASQSLHSHVDSTVVWAVNIGGACYQGADGIAYDADTFSDTAGAIASINAAIKGAQDDTVYRSYRTGNMHLQQPLANGIYDIVFRFAEPDELAIGERVFDVLAEQQTVLNHLDVKLARDGNAKSSLDRAVQNVQISDGVLDIQFNPIAGSPLLNAIVVRKAVNQGARANLPADTEQWRMVWHDEFDYQGKPDPAKWNYNIWQAGKVNDEEQAYTDQLDNVRVNNGKLIIEAHATADGITSGRIHTAGKGDLHYGRVEVRARLPKGRGTWPAIWMLPSDPFKYATTCEKNADWQGSANCNAWPNSGEIDIMEHVGYEQGIVHGTVHTKAYYWVNGEQRKASIQAPKVSAQFHVYAMQWSPNRIDIFLDDTHYFTYLKQNNQWQDWPFAHPFHLILNLAIGGGWGGAGGATDLTALPTRMEVDYVRMYKSK